MQTDTLRVDDDFVEVATHAVDDRRRVTLGDLLRDIHRVRVYRNTRGELFLQPVVEIPAAEAWLYRNPEALAAVQQGLKDAATGRLTPVDPERL